MYRAPILCNTSWRRSCMILNSVNEPAQFLVAILYTYLSLSIKVSSNVSFILAFFFFCSPKDLCTILLERGADSPILNWKNSICCLWMWHLWNPLVSVLQVRSFSGLKHDRRRPSSLAEMVNRGVLRVHDRADRYLPRSRDMFREPHQVVGWYWPKINFIVRVKIRSGIHVATHPHLYCIYSHVDCSKTTFLCFLIFQKNEV